jgi:hypothetical protein
MDRGVVVEDQTVVITSGRPREGAVRAWLGRLAAVPTARDVAWGLAALAGASVLLRLFLATVAHAPLIFSDELGYEKLAESIGRTGHLALFNQHGLSYSPLYPLVLSPIFALGASAPTAYALIKVVNAFLMTLAIFPTYKIARFVLPRRSSLLVAALSALAPLMFYASFSMSENLAYPVCLTAIWAMVAAVRTPSVWKDAVLLGSVLVAAATRAELAVLVPAALTAVLLAAAVGHEPGGILRRLLKAVAGHRLLFGAVAAALLAAGASALAGRGVYSILGRYAEVGRSALPSADRFFRMLAWHVAGVDLAVGVIPFVAALVAAAAFSRRRFRGSALPFAAVAVSVTIWLVVEVAYDAAVFDVSEIPRIHERFLIYVTPLFLVALLATFRIPEAEAPPALYLGSIGFATLLMLAIPFHTVINQPSAVDTFGLQWLAKTSRGKVVPVPHTTLIALAGALALGLLFFNVRRQVRPGVILMLIPLLLVGGQEMSRISAGSLFARSRLPAQTNWVDAAKPAGPVLLLTAAEDSTAALQTAYANDSISRLYYLCRPVAGPEFGERQVTIDASGRFRGPDGPVAASYAVAPAKLGLQGRIVARNRRGREVLVALPGGRLSVPTTQRSAATACRR